MLKSIVSLFQGTAYYYQAFFIIFIGFLASIVLHITYKLIKKIFYERNVLVGYVIVKSLYPPLLVYSWTKVLLNIAYQFQEQGYLSYLPIVTEDSVIQKMLIIAFGTSTSIRLVNTTSELIGNYLLKKWRIQPSFLRFGVRIINLGILVLFGFLSLHIINLPISKTLSNAATVIIVWAISFIAAYFLYLLGQGIRKRMSMKEEFSVGHELIIKLINPLTFMLIGSAALFSLQELELEFYMLNYVSYYEIGQLAFFWSLFRVTALLEGHFLSGSLTSTTSNKTMVQATGNVIRITLSLILILVLMRKMNYDVKGIVTLLGGASVALSLAGRDIIANYLSGLVIYSEGQFKVGDWIYSTSNDKVQGHIEYIGMRTTSIRTFDKRLLLVPNSFFSSNGIINASRMTHRRIKKEIPLGWLTSRDIIEKIVQEVRLLVYNHPGIDKVVLPPMVHLTGFEKSKVTITIYALTRTKNWHTYMNVQENILREIKSIIEKNGAVPPTDLMHIDIPSQISTDSSYEKGS